MAGSFYPLEKHVVSFRETWWWKQASCWLSSCSRDWLPSSVPGRGMWCWVGFQSLAFQWSFRRGHCVLLAQSTTCRNAACYRIKGPRHEIWGYCLLCHEMPSDPDSHHTLALAVISSMKIGHWIGWWSLLCVATLPAWWLGHIYGEVGCLSFLLFPSVSYQAHTFLCSLVGLEAEPTETLWEMLLGPHSITPFLPQWAGTIRSSTISCPQNLSQSLDLRVLPSRLDFRQEVNPPLSIHALCPCPLSISESTQAPSAVCWYTTCMQLKGALSQPGEAGSSGPVVRGEKLPWMWMCVCLSVCIDT